MKQITEQQILALAPNPAAAANGRKISQKGGFVRLECSADDTFYMGECTGSGKSNYITTADFIEPAAPVFRCSCPSRQFPCKHSLALLYEIMAKKAFGTCEIPEDIIKKREKKKARDEKAREKAAGAAAGGKNGDGTGDKTGDAAGSEIAESKIDGSKAAGSKNVSADRKEVSAAKAGQPGQSGKAGKSAKSGQSAKAKKIKKQLEGLELAAKLVSDLTTAGLGTMGGTALNTYKQLSKQLGDYYLPGPQRLLNRLILEIEAFQKDGKELHYEAAIDVLERFWSLTKKSQKYLADKLESGDVDLEDTLLHEELGGIWKLSELSALGRCKENRELIQTAFWVDYDEARKEYIDTGCYVDLENGEISMTYNYRPLKALKYVKQEDTLFGVARVPEAVYYPGDGNLRVRWDRAEVRPVEKADLMRLRSFASASLAAEAKAAKNLLKNAMADPMLIRLIAYEQIGQTDMGYVLCTADGGTILLDDMPGMEPTSQRLSLLPDGKLLKNQVLAGAFYYDQEARRLKLMPLSIVTESDIVRLLY